MLLTELFLIETLGRGGWFNPQTRKYHILEGEDHWEFVFNNPDIFGIDDQSDIPIDTQMKDWIRIIEYESGVRAPGAPFELGLEGEVEAMKHPNTLRFVIATLKGDPGGTLGYVGHTAVIVDADKLNENGQAVRYKQEKFSIPSEQGEMIRWFGRYSLDKILQSSNFTLSKTTIFPF